MVLDTEVLLSVKDPKRFLSQLSCRLGPAARRWALLRLRPALEALLPPRITWNAIEQVMSQTSLEELRMGRRSPRKFLELLALRAHPLAAQLAVELLMSKMWPSLHSLLEEEISFASKTDFRLLLERSSAFLRQLEATQCQA